MHSHSPITAIILAGGQSSRMGRDKGLLPFRGKMLVEYVMGAALELTKELILVTADPAYADFGHPCVADLYPGCGPLGGIYSGLYHSQTNRNLVLACDMPFLHRELLENLAGNSGEEQVLLTLHNDRPEPLCSVYDRSVQAVIRAQIEKNQLKITDTLDQLNTRRISFDREAWFRGNEFTNLNSPEEWLQNQPN